jgi:hypothetical protein
MGKMKDTLFDDLKDQILEYVKNHTDENTFRNLFEPSQLSLLCRRCNQKFESKDPKWCLSCNFNQYWQGPEFEKYSGPEYRT